MLGTRPNIELQAASAPEKDNSSTQSPNELAGMPDEILLRINSLLPSVKETARLAFVNRCFHGLFQPEIEKHAAKEAAEYAIYPTKDNVEKLKKLLSNCPALLLHPMTVKNRHGMAIQGTVYQIALHEGDNELIEDVIRPAFERLQNGLQEMEAQREMWLPKNWMETEDKICRSACEAIDQLFTVFKSASNANDVTELPEFPFTITINHQGAKEALEACKKSIAALYQPTFNMIIRGRDPIIRLLDRVIDRFDENYDALGGYDSPRNNAIMREVFGYCQRFAPINFMQAFAMGIFYIVENKEKLVRSFEYRNWRGHLILPLDSDPLFRLGYEYFAGPWRGGMAVGAMRGGGRGVQNFLSIKNSSSTILRYAASGTVLRNNVD